MVMAYIGIDKKYRKMIWALYGSKLKELHKNEEIITSDLRMSVNEFKKKYKWLRSDNGWYLKYINGRIINIDFIADYKGLHRSEIYDMPMDVYRRLKDEDYIEMYKELVEVMDKLGVD